MRYESVRDEKEMEKTTVDGWLISTIQKKEDETDLKDPLCLHDFIESFIVYLQPIGFFPANSSYILSNITIF